MLSPGQRFINWEKFHNTPPILELSIRDAGPGIPPDVIDRIFEPFFSTKPTGQGTGLGLSIVRRLVDQSNGCIYVQSAPGDGTEFRIYLPAQEIVHDTEDAAPGEST